MHLKNISLIKIEVPNPFPLAVGASFQKAIRHIATMGRRGPDLGSLRDRKNLATEPKPRQKQP